MSVRCSWKWYWAPRVLSRFNNIHEKSQYWLAVEIHCQKWSKNLINIEVVFQFQNERTKYLCLHMLLHRIKIDFSCTLLVQEIVCFLVQFGKNTHTHTPCMFPRNCTRNHILLLVPVSPVTRHNFRGHIYVSIAVLLRRQTLYNCNEVEYSRLLDTIFIYCVFEVGCSYLMV